MENNRRKNNNIQKLKQKPYILLFSCLNAKFRAKQKNPLNCGPKMAYLLKNLKIESLALKMSFLGGFLGCSLEKLLSYFKATHTDLSNCKFLSKNWIPYIWDQKCLSGVFYQLKFEKVLSILEKAPSDLSKWQASFKTKSFNVWDQNYLIWLFWAVISKYYFHIWNQHSQVCQYGKFCVKLRGKKVH